MSTPERLRADIDSGRTGDKIAASDPAAAPLGTDEEAAGTPLGRDAVEQARRREVVQETTHDREQGPGAAVPYVGIIAVLAAIVAGGALYFASMR